MPGTTKKAEKKPKTALDMVIHAIRNVPPNPNGNGNGISRTAILKYLKNEMDYDKPSLIKNALKKGVEKQKLIQTGQSFRVFGDAIPSPIPQVQVTMEDTKLGDEDGPQAEKGDTVVVCYEGKLEDGTVFDSAPTFEFTLGAGDVIKGWDTGIVGMRIGGKRKLFVPSKLGYGKRGSKPDIPPNADLYFRIRLKKIK